MARGFESKDVEFQQAEASRDKAASRALSSDERARESKRRSLELALTRAKAELALARSPAYRTMLSDAIGVLEGQLSQLRAE
jgi:hypothetical protein